MTESGAPQVDWELLRRSIEESTRFLDNVVTANAYVPAIPEVAAAAFRARRIGLGIMGLGDLMYELGIRYGSDEGRGVRRADHGVCALPLHAHEHRPGRSARPIPRLRGTASTTRSSLGGMKWQPPTPLDPFTRDWQRPQLDWRAIVGRHPASTASAMRRRRRLRPQAPLPRSAACEGYGCEPVFALGYIRHFKDGDRNVELVYTSPLFQQALDATDLEDARKQEIRQHVATYGSCQDIPDLPEAHPPRVCREQRHQRFRDHVRMQAAIQAFVDNSISKTCNFPEGATEEDVAKAYMLAWELGCKGLTVYVTGSRQEVVLETKATRARKEGDGVESAPTGASALVQSNGFTAIERQQRIERCRGCAPGAPGHGQAPATAAAEWRDLPQGNAAGHRLHYRQQRRHRTSPSRSS